MKSNRDENPPLRASFEADFLNPRFRPTMEDVHQVLDRFGPEQRDSLVAVYDGHGGKELADFAGAQLPRYLEEKLNDRSYPALKALRYSYLMTDIESRTRCCGDSGCTAVTCLVRDEGGGVRRLYTANAGDARAVLSQGGKAIRLSYDHKASDPSERERIEKCGGFVRMSRVMGLLAVSRSLGDHGFKSCVIAEPHLSECSLNDKSEFLIVACDGLWDVMDDQSAVDFVRRRLESRVENVAQALLEEAVVRGTQDNVTVIVALL